MTFLRDAPTLIDDMHSAIAQHGNAMIADESSPGYAGWRVCLAAFVGVMFSFAAMVPYTFSLFRLEA